MTKINIERNNSKFIEFYKLDDGTFFRDEEGDIGFKIHKIYNDDGTLYNSIILGEDHLYFTLYEEEANVIPYKGVDMKFY